MRHFKLPGKEADRTQGISKSEKRRLITLTVAALLVAGVLGNTFLRTRGGKSPVEDGDLPLERMTESVAVPKVDRAELEGLVSDASRADRVLLEREAVEKVGEVARRMTARHFELLEPETITPVDIGPLLEEPGAHRGQAFLARGWIETLRERKSASGDPEYLGTLVLEGGSLDDVEHLPVVYFVTYALSDGAALGSFVRIDGLFLKAFSDESEQRPGTWIDGPLLVGPRTVRSFPEGRTVDGLDINVMAQVEDDYLVNEDGSPHADWQGIPFEPLWHMMAYVRDLAPDELDWEKDALELDVDTVRRISENGQAFRGVPVRIPISRLQAVRVERAGENPSRIERYSKGWIGNVTWKTVIHFQTPLVLDDLAIGDYVVGRGFFLKNFAYPSAQKGLRVAPVLVLESLERFVPPRNPLFQNLGYAIAVTSALVVLTITLLLIRDRRQARALQEELVRRRRARRRQQEPGGSPGGSMGTV